MSTLNYAILTSLDGYIADSRGNFDWAEPQEDVHRYINKLEERNSAALYGRNMYEIMTFWEDLPDLASQPEYIQEYARIWKKTKKLVFSSSLQTISTANAALRKSFVKADIERIKKEETGSIGIGGAALASQALDLGLMDDLYLFIFPVIIGNGKRWIQSTAKVQLEKVETKEFLNGVLMVHYAVKTT